MAQLRQDYGLFTQRNAEILAVGPDGPRAFVKYWETERMPFIGLSDVGNQTARLYYQEFNLAKFGWVPAMFVIDIEGKIRFTHYGNSMADIPSNQEILNLLDEINK